MGAKVVAPNSVAISGAPSRSAASTAKSTTAGSAACVAAYEWNESPLPVPAPGRLVGATPKLKSTNGSTNTSLWRDLAADRRGDLRVERAEQLPLELRAARETHALRPARAGERLVQRVVAEHVRRPREAPRDGGDALDEVVLETDAAGPGPVRPEALEGPLHRRVLDVVEREDGVVAGSGARRRWPSSRAGRCRCTSARSRPGGSRSARRCRAGRAPARCARAARCSRARPRPGWASGRGSRPRGAPS